MTSGPRAFRIFAWTLFDFANTAFSVIIVTVVYSTYFIDQVAGGRRWLWGLAVSLSMVCAALLSPPLGAAADYSRSRKKFLFLFTLLSVICTACLFFVQQEMVMTGMLLFILANIGFEGGLVFYDAFLPRLTSKHTYGRVSGYGFAMGYVGALVVLLIVMFLLPDASDPSFLFFVRLSFVIAAAFFFIFSLPMFLFVPEPTQLVPENASFIRQGIREAAATFRALFIRHEHPAIERFLIAFLLYNDGILTVIAFAASFAREILRMSYSEIISFFAIVQTSAVIGSLIFGVITDKIGPKKTINITLPIWIGICIGSYFIQTIASFYVIGLIAGIAIGSSQSASRSLMALLTPKEHEAEFFGFYDGLCGKASAVIGPLVYGAIADFSNERFATLCIGMFFLAGLLILQTVVEPERVVA